MYNLSRGMELKTFNEVTRIKKKSTIATVGGEYGK